MKASRGGRKPGSGECGIARPQGMYRNGLFIGVFNPQTNEVARRVMVTDGNGFSMPGGWRVLDLGRTELPWDLDLRRLVGGKPAAYRRLQDFFIEHGTPAVQPKGIYDNQPGYKRPDIAGDGIRNPRNAKGAQGRRRFAKGTLDGLKELGNHGLRKAVEGSICWGAGGVAGGLIGRMAGRNIDNLGDLAKASKRAKTPRRGFGPAGSGIGDKAGQLTDNACGMAFGQRLLAEQGVTVFQSNLTKGYYKGLSPENLAKNMNRFQTGWRGFYACPTSKELSRLFASRGKFVARVGGNPGHFVNVESIKSGVVKFWDPNGGVFNNMPLDEFTEFVSGIVHR